jgi:hypothetical protein
MSVRKGNTSVPCPSSEHSVDQEGPGQFLIDWIIIALKTWSESTLPLMIWALGALALPFLSKDRVQNPDQHDEDRTAEDEQGRPKRSIFRSVDPVESNRSSGPGDEICAARFRILFTFHQADVAGTDLVIPIHQDAGDVVGDAAGGEYPVVARGDGRLFAYRHQ